MFSTIGSITTSPIVSIPGLLNVRCANAPYPDQPARDLLQVSLFPMRLPLSPLTPVQHLPLPRRSRRLAPHAFRALARRPPLARPRLAPEQRGACARELEARPKQRRAHRRGQRGRGGRRPRDETRRRRRAGAAPHDTRRRARARGVPWYEGLQDSPQAFKGWAAVGGVETG